MIYVKAKSRLKSHLKMEKGCQSRRFRVIHYRVVKRVISEVVTSKLRLPQSPPQITIDYPLHTEVARLRLKPSCTTYFSFEYIKNIAYPKGF